VTPMLEIESGAVPVLLTVTDWFPLDVPTRWFPKERVGSVMRP